ncbi:MAG: tetratricopeptide repeat protein [Coriobacteriia bacterium]
MSDEMHDAPEELAHETPDNEKELVPGWLALLVLVLLLAVTALGGFILRGALVGDDRVDDPAEFAVSEWQDKVAADPEDVDARLNLGYAYQQQGEWAKALEQYDAALERDPENMAGMYNKGVVLLETGESKAAEETLWDVLEIAPDHALAAKTLGELYIEQKHYKSALVAVEPVIETRPEFADLEFIAAYASEQLGDKEKAIGYYRAALKYSPDLVEAKDGLKRLGVTP